MVKFTGKLYGASGQWDILLLAWFIKWLLIYSVLFLFEPILVVYVLCLSYIGFQIYLFIFICAPHPEPPSHLPHHPIPQGHPSAPSLSILSDASNLDQWFASHMITYTFQHYPLKSSQPRLLPQSPKDCSLYLCLFCCLTYRVIVPIFLNPIYMHEYTVLVFFFLTCFTLYNWLQFHPPH